MTAEVGTATPRCYSITRRDRRSLVHVRHRLQPWLTLCGLSVAKWSAQPDDDATVTCSTCRGLDEHATALRAVGREPCLWLHKPWRHGSARVRCEQQLGHDTKHDGVEDDLAWDDGDDGA